MTPQFNYWFCDAVCTAETPEEVQAIWNQKLKAMYPATNNQKLTTKKQKSCLKQPNSY